MKVRKIISSDEFEVEGELKPGDIVKTENSLSIVVDVYHEEPEILKYLDIPSDKLKSYLPDITERGRVAKCITLFCDFPPSPGEDVFKATDEEIAHLHTKDGEFSMPYLSFLIRKCRDRLWIVKKHLERLESILPEQSEIIEIIKSEIEYGMLRGVEI